MGRLQDKIALITGGNSGIGKASARLFADEGAHVIITGRRADKGAETVREVEAAGGRVTYHAHDIQDYAACEGVVNAVMAAHGRIDVLFNNAGIVVYKNMLDITLEEWHASIQTNLTGVFYMSRLVVPHMIDQGGGVIVNMGSDWGMVGGRDAAAYTASKGAVVNLTRSMALDHGRQGIRVNAICPGDTYVERWHDGKDAFDPSPDLSFEEQLAEAGAVFALGRVAQADEIARAVLFLASDDSSYMTGQTLVVDGGNTAGGTAERFA